MTKETTAQTKRRDKLLFLVFGGALGIVLLVVGGYQLVEFSDSVAFCGRLCHNVMYPEYTTYQVSPHSRVACTECHVGPGADYLVKSKVSGVPMIISYISSTFDRPVPVPVQNLRPARETCEKCHRPEKFSGDLVRSHTTYATDEQNTSKTDTRVLRVGSGESDVAKDIHWHIAASVWYVAMDEKRQQVGWVGVEESAGQLTEYYDQKLAGEITPGRIQDEKRLTDCIDCHNRATHIFRSPEELINMAMVTGKIDSSLPFIKREGLKALDSPNTSLEEAITKVQSIQDFYRNSYPEVYRDKHAEVSRAVQQLREIARLTTFPDMNVTWETYKSNAGHEGCFRCHGKLVAQTGDNKGKAIDAGCDTCHYLNI